MLTSPDALYIDINVANRVPSIPGGHNEAARANVGMNAICPSTTNTVLSTKKKKSLGIPRERFWWVTRRSWVSDRGTDNNWDQEKQIHDCMRIKYG